MLCARNGEKTQTPAHNCHKDKHAHNARLQVHCISRWFRIVMTNFGGNYFIAHLNAASIMLDINKFSFCSVLLLNKQLQWIVCSTRFAIRPRSTQKPVQFSSCDVKSEFRLRIHTAYTNTNKSFLHLAYWCICSWRIN